MFAAERGRSPDKRPAIEPKTPFQVADPRHVGDVIRSKKGSARLKMEPGGRFQLSLVEHRPDDLLLAHVLIHLLHIHERPLFPAKRGRFFRHLAVHSLNSNRISVCPPLPAPSAASRISTSPMDAAKSSLRFLPPPSLLFLLARAKAKFWWDKLITRPSFPPSDWWGWLVGSASFAARRRILNSSSSRKEGTEEEEESEATTRNRQIFVKEEEDSQGGKQRSSGETLASAKKPAQREILFPVSLLERRLSWPASALAISQEAAFFETQRKRKGRKGSFFLPPANWRLNHSPTMVTRVIRPSTTEVATMPKRSSAWEAGDIPSEVALTATLPLTALSMTKLKAEGLEEYRTFYPPFVANCTKWSQNSG